MLLWEVDKPDGSTTTKMTVPTFLSKLLWSFIRQHVFSNKWKNMTAWKRYQFTSNKVSLYWNYYWSFVSVWFRIWAWLAQQGVHSNNLPWVTVIWWAHKCRNVSAFKWASHVIDHLVYRNWLMMGQSVLSALRSSQRSSMTLVIWWETAELCANVSTPSAWAAY